MISTSISIHVRKLDDLEVKYWDAEDSPSHEKQLVVRFGYNAVVFMTPEQAEQLAKAILSKLQQTQEEEINA